MVKSQDSGTLEEVGYTPWRRKTERSFWSADNFLLFDMSAEYTGMVGLVKNSLSWTFMKGHFSVTYT